MVITDDVVLPTHDELTVQEINVSSPVLRAASLHLGIFCDRECKEYMLCKEEELDPRNCIKEGKVVTACGMRFFNNVKKTCSTELDEFARCLEWCSTELRMEHCRKQQTQYDACMYDKLGVTRPPFGYFSQVRLHTTDRPKPKPYLPEFPNPTPYLPDDYPKEPARHGKRQHFIP